MRHLVATIAGCIVLASMAIPQVAMADLGEVLGEIEWGDDRGEVIEKLRSSKLDEMREDPSLRGNPTAMQRARQRVLDEVRDIEDSHYELEGEQTDYDMSVVAGEFTVNNGESLIRMRDDIAQRYYFFLDDEFYKLTVVYDADQIQNLGFQAFVNRVQRQYGEPASTEYDDGQLERAVWKDGGYKLRVDDRSNYFGTYTMSFSDRSRVRQLRAEDREFGGRGHDYDQERHEVSDRVQAVTQPSDHRQRESAADAITGRSVDDVTLGDDDEEEQEHEEETARADEDPAPEPDPDPEPAADASDDDQQPQPTPEAGGTEEDDEDDDLVIY